MLAGAFQDTVRNESPAIARVDDGAEGMVNGVADITVLAPAPCVVTGVMRTK